MRQIGHRFHHLLFGDLIQGIHIRIGGSLAEICPPVGGNFRQREQGADMVALMHAHEAVNLAGRDIDILGFKGSLKGGDRTERTKIHHGSGPIEDDCFEAHSRPQILIRQCVNLVTVMWLMSYNCSVLKIIYQPEIRKTSCEDCGELANFYLFWLPAYQWSAALARQHRYRASCFLRSPESGVHPESWRIPRSLQKLGHTRICHHHHPCNVVERPA